METEGKFNFSVDSALLAELGERLVGKPYIALAELVKNSYDADATEVNVTLNLSENLIVVDDNGHGMTLEEFDKFWMRIGSTHKVSKKVSKKYQRLMTGSKGVGRLAVQFLAKKLEIHTVSDDNPNQLLIAKVNWDEAKQAGDLTEAEVTWEIEQGVDFEIGTRLFLHELTSSWKATDIAGLAQEIWWLTPPFRQSTKQKGTAPSFDVEFISHKNLVDVFNKQMGAILDIWIARIIGRNDNGLVSLSLEWAGEKSEKHEFKIPDCALEEGDFEIRIYRLTSRQPRGIKVGEARVYLNKYGGVNIYDGGFRLPYYGDQKNDWLSIEQDHSHRLSVSKLLPKEIRKGVDRGLQFLPTLSRIIGVLNVASSHEDALTLLVTRDRLQESQAFNDLHYMVRYAIDFYALREQQRSIRKKKRKAKTMRVKTRKVKKVLEDYKAEIPTEVYDELEKDVVEVTEDVQSELEETSNLISLVGSLATAGISSLAYQHETKRQFRRIDSIIKQIAKIEDKIENKSLQSNLRKLRKDLTKWVDRSRKTNALFNYLSEPENLDIRERFPIRVTLDTIRSQVGIMLKQTNIRIDRISSDHLFPKASIAEWNSIFQNVLINAYNAMLDSKKKEIDISVRTRGFIHEVLIQDTGYGVQLKDSDRLFEPFERDTRISAEMKSLGYGGSGLGLTIVKMIANNLGCSVSFVEPEKGFKTAFSLIWREAS